MLGPLLVASSGLFVTAILVLVAFVVGSMLPFWLRGARPTISSPSRMPGRSLRLSPDQVMLRWMDALATGDLRVAEQHTSTSTSDHIVRRWTSLAELSAKVRQYPPIIEMVEHPTIDGVMARVSYSAYYPDGSRKRWENALQLEDGIWKVLPPYLQMWPGDLPLK
jgi:hypothetical protein